MISEPLAVPVGAAVSYTVRIAVPGLDFRGRPNRLDRVEILSNCLGEPAVVKTFDGIGPGNAVLTYILPSQSTARPRTFYLRSRGRRFIGGAGDDVENADYQFYTGATFVRVMGKS